MKCPGGNGARTQKNLAILTANVPSICSLDDFYGHERRHAYSKCFRDLTLTKANGNKANGKATANSTGTASWSNRLGSKDPTGSYSAMAQASSGSQTATSNTATFTVQ